MDRRRTKQIVVAIVLMLLTGPIFNAAQVVAEEAPRMSKEVLLALLDNSAVAIIDLRLGTDWNASEFKIKGAVRESIDSIAWAEKYPKNKLLVLYCA